MKKQDRSSVSPRAWSRRDLVLWTILLFAARVSNAQVASTGSIFGVVSDTADAVVPGAEIRLTHVGMQVVRTVSSNDLGFYAAESLLAGTYLVTVSKAGFNRMTFQDVVLEPGRRLQVNAVIEVGDVQTNVTVEAHAAVVQTESGESAGVVTSQQVDNLLLNGRNFMGLALLVPGVNLTTSSGRTIGGGSLSIGGLSGETPISVAGLGREYASYTVDGAYNQNVANQINLNVTPPVDTIAEFRILKNNYSAKNGIGGAAQILTETKTGTLTYHGTVYEYLRNDSFDAKNFFAASKSSLRQHNFGFSIGGPLQIPKLYNTRRDQGTFFFVNEEFRVIHSGLTLRGAVIPQAMRDGDFSGSPSLGNVQLPSGQTVKQLRFSDTAQQVMAGKNVPCQLTPTRLNPACFDPNAVAFMKRYFPLPNNPAGGFLNFLNAGVQRINQRNDTFRLDHYFGQKHVLMMRAMIEDVYDASPANTYNGNVITSIPQSIYSNGHNMVARLTSTLSPRFVNTISGVYTDDQYLLAAYNTDLPADIKINYPYPNADAYHRIPNVSISGGWSGFSTQLPIRPTRPMRTFSDDISIVRGSHVLQAGMLLIFANQSRNLTNNAQGSFSFSGVHTNDSVADFLLGTFAGYTQGSFERVGRLRYYQAEPYFQDDWKVSRRLTLNLGLRWSYQGAETVDNNEATSMDLRRYDPARAGFVNLNGTFRTNDAGQVVTAAGQPADPGNGLIYAGRDGVPPGFYNPSKRLWAPRFGFAWDPAGTGKTSIRGGFGMGYGGIRYFYTIYSTLSNLPYVSQISLLNGTITNPLLGTPGATTPSAGFIVDPKFVPTTVQTWSMTVQRQVLRAGVFTVAYAGSGARHVLGLMDMNAALPMAQPSTTGCLAPGQAVPSGKFDFDPCINTGRASVNVTRPYLGWAGLNTDDMSGTSNYHSLESSFQYRTSALTLNIAYTFGKVLTTVANRALDGRNSGNTPQNARNSRAEYGPPGWDRTHIFTAGYVYRLPFLRHAGGPLKKVFSNWSFSGITVVESGFALSPSVSTGRQGLARRPDVVGSIAGPKTLQKWFNTAAFTPPAYGFYGNAGNGLIRGPGENTWNWSLFKTVSVKERLRIQLRAEAFNIWNHPNFDAVGTAVGTGTYGTVTRAMEPRIMEFVVRVSF